MLTRPPRRKDAKLEALAREPEFARLRFRQLVFLGTVLDRGRVARDATLAVRGIRIVEPLIVAAGTVLIDHGTRRSRVTVGLDVADPMRVAACTVTAFTELQVWFVEPRAVRRVLALAPHLRCREAAA